ncbi:gibberellin 3-beta-dioxygenase 1-like [Hibiscus syriacus]|uniref:Gibberellin 3-beta-dioxygenase 1-like n=1 Tax=Hibiscus syriacus TaxID=106335 RepID=A0A6A3C735_HIBSY|nr:probable 2-oxoglutarate-dependent dioxygenase AOP1 [Hibiscus syriacus]KAE8724586.1 gibberellin 3-beta-dioxygenase 1-like [Hibiscus syriacus]
MSSETPVRLPIVDFSKHGLKAGSPEWDSVKVKSSRHWKSTVFPAMFDRVLDLRKPILGALEDLFDLPFQTKQHYVSDKPFRGYYGDSSGVGQECMVIDDAKVVENIETGLTNTLWPKGNVSFSKSLVSFTELASELEKIIRRMILENFGVEKYTDEFIDSTNYLLKVMKYEGSETSEPSLRAHSDQNLTTILYQNEVDGLEIQNKDGEWINVKPSPNSFIFILGESLSIWLNGRLSSPYHRVVMKGNKVRYSIGLFAIARGGYQVKVPEELVDDKNSLLFKPFDYEEFLGLYSAKAARGALLGYGLKSYCSA